MDVIIRVRHWLHNLRHRFRHQWIGGMVVVFVGAIAAFTLTAIALDNRWAPPTPPPDTTSIHTISWEFTANRYRDWVGEEISLYCPPNGVVNRLWGSDVYSDQSSICTAAVHAGLITLEEGGAIAIRIMPGQDAYEGSTQNDITSSGLGEWPGSFTFTTLRDTVVGILRTDAGAVPMRVATWKSTAMPFVDRELDQVFAVYCPGDGTLETVWGSDIYRDASSLCTAAVHAGQITVRDGGAIAFRIVPRMPFYIGSNRNGITTRHWMGGERSFQFVARQTPT